MGCVYGGKWGSAVFFSSSFLGGVDGVGMVVVVVVRGYGGFLEAFQTVPFCFQRRLHLCKCALCPLVHCLNSIVDFCGKLTGALGAQEARGTRGEKGGGGGCLNDSDPRVTGLQKYD